MTVAGRLVGRASAVLLLLGAIAGCGAGGPRYSRELRAQLASDAVSAARERAPDLIAQVEAALDDMNLRRLLSLIEEFRKEAQLIIVSHQKKTMESADVLYGVTMPEPGVSRLVSMTLD